MKKKYLLPLFVLLLSPLFLFSQVEVSGTVQDDAGLPLVGVNIVEKGTTNGTATDFDGNYTIMVADGASLVFSYIGYSTGRGRQQQDNN